MGDTPTEVAAAVGGQAPIQAVVDRVVVQGGSINDLEAQNATLQEQLRAAEAAEQETQRTLNESLKASKQKLWESTVRSKVLHLNVLGYVAPAQVEAGLIEVLSLIPEDATVKGRPALDVALDCIKYGGALKLKGEVASIKEPVKPKQTDKDLHVLENGSRMTVTNVDTAVRARQLRAEGKNPDAALAQAIAERGEQ